MSAAGNVLRKVKRGIYKHFIEPSKKVREHNKKMDALNKAKAESGAFNTGEDYAKGQSI